MNLFFSVRDRKGAYVSTLGKEDFTVYEDGKPQEIRYFSRETDQPLTLGLLVDVSRSQEALIEVERRASARFLERVLREKDMAFLISFGVDAELLQDFTNSPVLLARGLERLRLNAGVSGMSPTGSPVPMPGGPRGTVLYDAVWLASREKLRNEVGRKALVVITDGVDVGSRVKLEEAIEEAQRADRHRLRHPVRGSPLHLVAVWRRLRRGSDAADDGRNGRARVPRQPARVAG